MPDVEVEAAQDGLEALGVVTAAELLLIWDALGSWNEGDIPGFVTAATPVVAASTVTATRIQSSLIGYVTRSAAPVIDPAPLVARQLKRLEEPFHATWHALAEHQPWAEAIEVGRSDMQAEGLDIAHRTARDAMAEVGKSEPTLRVKRVANAGACPWCMKRDGGIYLSAEDATYGHKRCKCAAVPHLG